jgi:hypothetical protein
LDGSGQRILGHIFQIKQPWKIILNRGAKARGLHPRAPEAEWVAWEQVFEGFYASFLVISLKQEKEKFESDLVQCQHDLAQAIAEGLRQ